MTHTATRAARAAAAVLALAGCGSTPAKQLSPLPSASTSRPASSCHTGPNGRPDPACTPGVTNPDVTPATVNKTICTVGWTATIRPPSSYTSRLKIQQIRAYGYPDTDPAGYEEDHLVPLELGGDPYDARNLWPEPLTQSRTKDQVENALHTQVCAGTTTLDSARAKILADWGPATPSPVPSVSRRVS